MTWSTSPTISGSSAEVGSSKSIIFGPVPLAALADYPVLTQSEASGLQRLVLEWLGANGLR